MSSPITARNLITGLLVGAAIGAIGQVFNWLQLRITTRVSPLHHLIVLGAIGGAIVGVLFVLLSPLRRRGRLGFWASWVIIGHLLIGIGMIFLPVDFSPLGTILIGELCAWGAGLSMGIAHRQWQGASYRDPI